MKRIVLDASVVLKWYLPDENSGEKALSLLHQYVSGELDILGPTLLEYEVMNALLLAQKRGRIREEKVLLAVEGFIDLQITLKSVSSFYFKAIHYSRAYNRSAYDASYLAVADQEGLSIITADQGLYNAVKKDLKWIKWLGDI